MKKIINKVILDSNIVLSIALVVLFCFSNLLHVLFIIYMCYDKFNKEIKLFFVLILSQILISIAFVLSITCFITMVIYFILKFKKLQSSLKTLYICVSYSVLPLIVANLILGIIFIYNYTKIDLSNLSFFEFSNNISELTFKISNSIIIRFLKYFFYFISILLLIILTKQYKDIIVERVDENSDQF